MNIEGQGQTKSSVSRGANRTIHGCQLTTLLQNFLSKELRSALLSSWKLSSKFWSLQKSLNVLTALSAALLADLERLSCRSCSISSSSVLV